MLALAILGAPALTACYSYKAVYEGTLTSGSLVEARFSQPREIVATRRSGDSLSIRGVAALEGRVVSGVEDAFVLLLAKAVDARGGRLTVPLGSTVAVSRDMGTIVSIRQKDERRTERAVLGGIAGAAFMLLLAFWALGSAFSS